MRTVPRLESALLLACISVIAALLYNLSRQHFAIPSVMRYMPAESSAYVFTSPLADLWLGAAPHLQGYFDGSEDTVARRSAAQVSALLDEKGIRLRGPDDLERVGVKSTAPAAAALVPTATGLHFVLALPIADQDKFLDTLRLLWSEPISEWPQEKTGTVPRRTVYRVGPFALAFSEDDVAVASDDLELLYRALGRQVANLDFHRSSDRARVSVDTLLRQNKREGNAWLRGQIRSSADPIPVDIEFAVGFEAKILALGAASDIPAARSDVLARFLSSGEPASIPTELLFRTEAALSLHEPSLASLVRHLPESATFDALFPKLRAELAAAQGLTGFTLSATDASERVPSLVMGLQLPEKEAALLIFRLQSSLRLKRDSQILLEAMRLHRERAGLADNSPVSVDDLVGTGLLTRERHTLWQRYQFSGGGVKPIPPGVSADDFKNDSYLKLGAAGVQLRYVMPPFTDDDVAYRVDAVSATIDTAELKNDKYRLCSYYDGGTLWLGNDADVLDGWIQRMRRAPLSTEHQQILARSPQTPGTKLRVVLRPSRLLESGQLHPDKQVNDRARELLFDLSQYRAGLVTISGRNPDGKVYASAVFLR